MWIESIGVLKTRSTNVAVGLGWRELSCQNTKRLYEDTRCQRRRTARTDKVAVTLTYIFESPSNVWRGTCSVEVCPIQVIF